MKNNPRIIRMVDVEDSPFGYESCAAIDAFKKIESRDQLPVLRIRWKKEKETDPVTLDVTMEDHHHVYYRYNGLSRTVTEIPASEY